MKLTVVIDPNLFFVGNKGKIIAHPLVCNWLASLKNNSSITKTQLCFLVRESQHPAINIPASNHKFDLPFNDMFFDLLTDETHNYINMAFNGQLKWADISPETELGIRLSQNQDDPSHNETVVITADAEMVTYFRNKNVTVVEMNHTYQPILSSQFDELINDGKVEVYCDFDGTILNIDSLILLNKIANLNEISDLQLIHAQTISLLKKFSGNKIQLLTQREYDVDGQQPPYCSARSVIETLNKEHGLNIQYHEANFLNARSQINQHQDYTKKIQVIYDRLKNMKMEDRPKHIAYADDQIDEISAAEHFKSVFEKELSVNLHIALINHPEYFLQNNCDLFKKTVPFFSEKIQQLYQQEFKKLNDAFNFLKIKQEEEMKKKENYALMPTIGFFAGLKAIANLAADCLGMTESSRVHSCN